MIKTKKVYVLGREDSGWSIDKDRAYTEKAIRQLGYEIVENPLYADIIYAIWWNQLTSWKMILFNKIFKNKRIVAVITNDLEHQENKLHKIKKLVDIFVYASSKQKAQLIEFGITSDKLFMNPFYVDEKIFHPLKKEKIDIAKILNIDYNRLKDKVLVGSFQRDSLGADLKQPKWQKNPDLLIGIMKKLDKQKYLLVLAGPRRHYIVNECSKFGINYIFVGDEKYIEKMDDDLSVNILGDNKMNLLYNLIDLYIVSSSSEGGPKAIPEAVLTHTAIFSTDVGFAKDLLDDECIYTTVDDAVSKASKLFNYTDFYKKILHNNMMKVGQFYNYNLYIQRTDDILKKALS